MPIQTAADSISNSAGSPYGFKNRIINGAMVIDQRNAGASLTISTAGYQYPVDRFGVYGQTSDGVFTAQQSSIVPNNNFTKSLKIQTTTIDSSIGATQLYMITHRIEGYNTADLGWGNSTASTVTLSFWVRSSLTGTFGGAIINENQNRGYPFSYTISAADTWQQVSIVVPGDTTGTWATTNGRGIEINWDLGSGSTYKGTAGSWSASPYWGVTGGTNVIGTLNATFYITGVQLEKGTQATAFDYRDFGRELALCQRYFCKTFPFATAPAQNTDSPGSIAFISYAANLYDAMWRFPVEMRASPGTMTTYSPNAANANWSNNGGTPTASIVHSASTGITIRAASPAGAGYSHIIHASASAEL
jgi:hypothetical protein